MFNNKSIGDDILNIFRVTHNYLDINKYSKKI